MGVGLVQVYSSSFILASESLNDPLFFFKRQSVYVLFGLLAILIGFFTPWKFYEKWGVIIWLVSAVGVVLTLLPGVGVKVGGARRWVQVGSFFRWEPGELLKLSFPFYFTWYRKKFDEFSRSHHIIALLLLFVPLAMLFLQPDFGTFVIIFTVGIILLYISGINIKYFAWSAFVVLPLFYFSVMKVEYRRERVLAFLNPWADASDNGFQLIQSLLSVRSGGLFGEGLGLSQGKLYFLPEAHTDFTLAVFAEESGFIGVLLLMLLYGFIILKGFQIALRAIDSNSRWISLGVIITFAFSVLINVGVVMGMLPTKGLTLPFISYGGSSIVALSWAFGVLLNIDKTSQSQQSKSSIFTT
jgi:cell division protein FtsW